MGRGFGNEVLCPARAPGHVGNYRRDRPVGTPVIRVGWGEGWVGRSWGLGGAGTWGPAGAWEVRGPGPLVSARREGLGS